MTTIHVGVLTNSRFLVKKLTIIRVPIAVNKLGNASTVPGTSRRRYDGMYHSPGAVFQSRSLDSQEGANIERYVFGKLSARSFQRLPFFLAPALLFQPWRYRPCKIGPGGVRYTVVCRKASQALKDACYPSVVPTSLRERVRANIFSVRAHTAHTAHVRKLAMAAARQSHFLKVAFEALSETTQYEFLQGPRPLKGASSQRDLTL